MTTPATENWHQANQQYLMRQIAAVRELLTRHIDCARETKVEVSETAEPVRVDTPAEMRTPSALDSICSAFSLTPFERSILILCAAIELDSQFVQLCSAAQGKTHHPFATFSLALAAFPDAHWSALVPSAPLRRWRFIEIGSGDNLTTTPLRIDERVLHYLAGVSYLDIRLHGFVKPVSARGEIAISHKEISQRVAACWRRSRRDSHWPIVHLIGNDSTGAYDVAAAAAGELRMQLYWMRAADIPSVASEREMLARLWERESVMAGCALLIDAGDVEQRGIMISFLEGIQGPILVTAFEPLRLKEKTVIRMEVRKPSRKEQRQIWEQMLPEAAVQMNGQLDHLVNQFDLSTHGIQTASAQVLSEAESIEFLPSLLWDACRIQSRSDLEELAQRLEPVADWEDLVLPAPQMHTLHEIVAHVRERAKVYDRWGFCTKGSRGLGISALFAGSSGTGKTMAAEVLAKTLRLDLHVIDLSQVVSKFIGETEKNLRRVFDAAEEGGAVLLFDEADALFGKRTEVKDSHDRYANIEISYLLQRMESYRGLAILTTNMKTVLDSAFIRRLRFVVQFPFPDAGQRLEIWRRVFPEDTPTENLDLGKLSRLSVAGGNIRNIALHAAFLAAQLDQPVRMNHILHAAQREYEKLEKSLSQAEIREWV